MRNLIKSAIFGLAVGDALGVPAEFLQRWYLEDNPVTDMVGFGSHKVPKGSWSDDTSMTLCTLNSIANCGEINLTDIMNEFVKWVNEGYMTPKGRVFDIGKTCLKAIVNFMKENDVYNCGLDTEMSNGNGALMRILPVSLYNFVKGLDDDNSIDNIEIVASLTHSHDRSNMACGIYDFIVSELLAKQDIGSIARGLEKANEYYKDHFEHNTFLRLFQYDFKDTKESDIKSSGYVVHTLEAAVWCVLNTNSYKECVLKAVNLGNDTDTVAAVAGSLAGILYGFNSIPDDWIKSLIKNKDITTLSDNFLISIM